ncbi:MAG: hypothetical protein IPI48_16335 [bacterium]|nr:hypothetical protein [bacterium]
MTPTKKDARLAGLLYLPVVFPDPFVLFYVPGRTFAPGDASATVANLLAHESLFRANIVIGMVSQLFFVASVLALASPMVPEIPMEVAPRHLRRRKPHEPAPACASGPLAQRSRIRGELRRRKPHPRRPASLSAWPRRSHRRPGGGSGERWPRNAAGSGVPDQITARSAGFSAWNWRPEISNKVIPIPFSNSNSDKDSASLGSFSGPFLPIRAKT